MHVHTIETWLLQTQRKQNHNFSESFVGSSAIWKKFLELKLIQI